MKKFHSSPPLVEDATIVAIAAKHSTTPQAVRLAWGVSRPTAVIPKSVTAARIKAVTFFFSASPMSRGYARSAMALHRTASESTAVLHALQVLTIAARPAAVHSWRATAWMSSGADLVARPTFGAKQERKVWVNIP